MPWFSAIVLFIFIWFLTFLTVLPLRLKTQGESGEIVPGTPSSAPANLNMRRKLVITSVVATILFVIVTWVILSGVISIEDVDVIRRWSQGAAAG